MLAATAVAAPAAASPEYPLVAVDSIDRQTLTVTLTSGPEFLREPDPVDASVPWGIFRYRYRVTLKSTVPCAYLSVGLGGVEGASEVSGDFEGTALPGETRTLEGNGQYSGCTDDDTVGDWGRRQAAVEVTAPCTVSTDQAAAAPTYPLLVGGTIVDLCADDGDDREETPAPCRLERRSGTAYPLVAISVGGEGVAPCPDPPTDPCAGGRSGRTAYPLIAVPVGDCGNSVPTELQCTGGGACSGKVTITESARRARAARKPQVLGRRSFKIHAGKTKALRVKLSRNARSLIRKHKKVRARMLITGRDGDGKPFKIAKSLVLKR